MSSLDITIIIVYLLAVTAVGIAVSRKSSGSLKDYFLGGRSIPWYILGLSGMANFIDMGGTAYQSGWYYLIGAKGFWVCVEGAVALLLSFQMVYAAKWLRRSDCMTNAEWMVFRFGDNDDGKAARITSAVSALLICGGLMAFFFTGAAKVLPTFLPFFQDWAPESWGPAGPGRMAALCFFLLVGIYTVTSGFRGVIYTDLFQSGLILMLILYVAFKAWTVGTPEYFAEHAPAGWFELFPSGESLGAELPEKYGALSDYTGKAAGLGMLVLLWIANNVFQGLATPFDAWTAQRYYAAKNEREASLTVFQWIGVWSLRFLLMAGIGVLALGLADKIGHPEEAMSIVIREVIPVGIQGLLLAALLAAGMSTIDSTANSSASYFVKDVYQPFINPEADEKRLVRVSHITTFLLMAAGVAVGFGVKDVNAIWGWIITGLFVGTLPANIAKWFWWRTSGFGFMTGTVSGLAAALLPQLVPDWFAGLNAWQSYAFVFLAGTFGTAAGSLLKPSKDREAVRRFFTRTRPFGFWKPVRAECSEETRGLTRKENRNDLIALPLACCWHFSLFLMMSSIMFRDWRTVGICAGVFLLSGALLYHFWFRQLPKAVPEDL